jgi:putative membrane protein
MLMKRLLAMVFLPALIGTSHVGVAADTMSHVFLRDAIKENNIQIQLGELAQENAENPDVKAFSDTLVVDCTLANKQAEEIASQVGLEVSAEPNVSQKAVLNRLSKLKGGAFDRAFVREIIAEHKADLARFHNQASKTDNAVAEYARQIIPTLKSHLETAEKLRAGL